MIALDEKTEDFVRVLQNTEALRRVDLFQSTHESHLSLIAYYAKKERFSPGDILCQEGGSEGKLFFLLSGEVNATRGNTLLGKMGAGECIGELAFIDGGTHAATVTALTHVEAITLDHDSFKHIQTIEPKISMDLLSVLTKRIRVLLEQQYKSQ